jgi:hypothetical protein
MADQSGESGPSTPARHTAARRQLLKTLTIAGGAIATGKALPEQWTKPLVDSAVLPVHAAATYPLTLLAQVEVDKAGPDGTDEGALDNADQGEDGDGDAYSVVLDAGTNNIDAMDDDGWSSDESVRLSIIGTVNPHTAAHTISATAAVTQGTGSLVNTPPANVSTDIADGTFAFGDVDSANIADPSPSQVTVTVSTPSAANQVIVINFVA